MTTTKYSLVLFALILIYPTSGVSQNNDIKGSKDHPLITRLSNFCIGQYEENEFETEKFKTNEGTIPVEGHKYVIDYRLTESATPSGKSQILKNYQSALLGIGAEIKLEGSYYHVYKLSKNNMETWVKVDPGNYDGKRYTLTIVESALLKQEVLADASKMKNSILNTGHIAIYGIHFDSGKAVVKDNSEIALKEIAKVLQKNPTLSLYIVGHTDSDGDLYANMELSAKRANEVINVLVDKYSIDRSRLSPKGLGSLAPVASNRTEEGKAKNRRVELVEK